MNKLILCFLFLLGTLCTMSQTTVVLQASQDNTIYSESDNSNALGPNFTTGVTRSGSIRRALVKFDLSSIPAAATITSVTLTLTLNKTKPGADNVALQKLNKDWGEGSSVGPDDGDGTGVPATAGDATWNQNFFGSSGWSPGGDFVGPPPSAVTSVAGTLGTYTWTSAQMKTDAQGWLNDASTNFGWIIRSNESSSSTVNRFSSKDNTNPSDRPKLSVTFTAPTPVTLSSFKVAEGKTGMILGWQTSSEFNNSFFSVQHSTDGVTFTTIGKVKGAGTSTIVHDYQFTHQGVSEGKHFYRLGQTDIDGTVHYSNVVSAISRDKHMMISISPNPVKDIINLGGISISPATSYLVLNAAGKIVQKGSLLSGQINVTSLANGVYTLKIFNQNTESLSGIFLKQ